MLRSIRVAAVATLLSPLLTAAPAVLAAPPTPEPVAPSVQEIALPALPSDGTASSVTKSSAGAGVTTEELETEPFSVVGVTWQDDAAVTDVGVAVRTRTDGSWTDWTSLEGEDDNSPDDGTAEEERQRAGTAPYWVGKSDGVQVRVTAGAVAPTDLEVALVDPGTSDTDATVTSESGSTAQAALARPAIKTRAQWGADESIRGGSSAASSISAVTLHHTASSNSYTEAQVPSLIRGFYAYHVRSRGWSDIGYNFLVDKYGNMWEGRAGGMDRAIIGAHAGGFNTATVGVSMIGTYENVSPSPAALRAVAQISAWKLSMYGRDPHGSVTLTSGGSTRFRSGTRVTLPRIFGHRQVSATSCPGTRGYAAMPGLRDSVASIMAGGGASYEPANAEPIGSIDALHPQSDGTASLRGWAMDPDTKDPIQVVVWVDGTEVARFSADGTREDVGAAYRNGNAHGFDLRVPVPAGEHQVCVWAKDSETGAGVSLGGCPSITMTTSQPEPVEPEPKPSEPPPEESKPSNAPPTGSLDTVQAPKDDVAGPVELAGWAIDPDTDDPVVVALSVNGTEEERVVADLPRPDLKPLGHGEEHGWQATLELPAGRQEVCAAALDAATGAPTRLRCQVLQLAENVEPVGSLDAVGPWRNSTVLLRGWAVDRNADGPVDITVTVDGKPARRVVADRPRPDVTRALGTPRDAHGFDLALPAERGKHEVCVLARDTSTDEAKTLRCEEVVVGPHRRMRAA